MSCLILELLSKYFFAFVVKKKLHKTVQLSEIFISPVWYLIIGQFCEKHNICRIGPQNIKKKNISLRNVFEKYQQKAHGPHNSSEQSLHIPKRFLKIYINLQQTLNSLWGPNII